jgi:hypothetical protein
LPESVAAKWLAAVMIDADSSIDVLALRHAMSVIKPVVSASRLAQDSWTRWLYSVERQEIPEPKLLSTAQWQDLKSNLSGHSDAHRHIALTVLAHDQGFSVRQISLHLGVSRNSVRRYLRLHSSQGAGGGIFTKGASQAFRRRFVEEDRLRSAA